MKSGKISALVLLLALNFTPILSQEGETPAQENKGKISSTGAVYSEYLGLENFDFWKKIAPSGRGEFLELSFDVVNKTDVNIPLRMFIIGFHETDEKIESLHRKYNEYPVWRTYDIDAEKKKIVFFQSIPEIATSDVSAWKGKEVPEEQKMSRWRKPVYESFIDYVNYIEQNPDAGIEIPLQGMENTETKNLKTDIYNVVSKSQKTTVWANLYSRRAATQRFFNHVGIILYDTEEKKVIFRQFYTINDKIKIR